MLYFELDEGFFLHYLLGNLRKTCLWETNVENLSAALFILILLLFSEIITVTEYGAANTKKCIKTCSKIKNLKLNLR